MRTKTGNGGVARGPGNRYRLLAGIRSAIVAAALGCASAHPREPASAAPVVFAVSSMPSGYGIQGRFRGSVTRHADWVTVTITGGAIRTQQGDPRPVWDLRLRAALATCARGSEWLVVSESPAIRLAPAARVPQTEGIVDTTTHELQDTLRLAVAIPPDVSPVQARLVLRLEWPFENLFASYELATDVALAEQPVGLRLVERPTGRGPRRQEDRCG